MTPKRFRASLNDARRFAVDRLVETQEDIEGSLRAERDAARAELDEAVRLLRDYQGWENPDVVRYHRDNHGTGWVSTECDEYWCKVRCDWARRFNAFLAKHKETK